MSNGSLESLLVKRKTQKWCERVFLQHDDLWCARSWAELMQMAIDAATGIAYLHSENVIHRGKCCPVSTNSQPAVSQIWRCAICLLTAKAECALPISACRAVHPTTPAQGRSRLRGLRQKAKILHRCAALLRIDGCFAAALDGPSTGQSDVFSFGVCLWEMLTRSDPHAAFAAQLAEELANRGEKPRVITATDIGLAVKAGKRLRVPDETPTPIALLIADCWRAEPHRRPDMALVLERLRAAAPPRQDQKTSTTGQVLRFRRCSCFIVSVNREVSCPRCRLRRRVTWTRAFTRWLRRSRCCVR